MSTLRLLGTFALGLALSPCIWAADNTPDLSQGFNKSALPPDTFEPVSQSERFDRFARGIVSPGPIIWAAAGAGIWQAAGTPREWKGAEGFGLRFGSGYAQYLTDHTLNYGLAAALHEDNRYFPSGETGVFRRTKYALMSSLLCRHDNGKRYLSVSQFGGMWGQAFISRAWQPRSTSTAGDAALSFGFWMAGDMSFNVIREFRPQRRPRRE